MAKYDCEEVPEQPFQIEEINFFPKNSGAHFTLGISNNQRFGT